MSVRGKPFLTMLHNGERHSAEGFCREHKDDLGKRCTLDLGELTEGLSPGERCASRCMPVATSFKLPDQGFR